eukprot:COSAG01_NODE_34915_length_540_cov_0.705215_1_plen_83_part_10
MDPDSDGEVKLQYADGSESGYIGISQLAPATRAEFARQQLAYSWCKEGAFAGRIGQITMDPDCDGELTLEYPYRLESGYIGFS